MPRQKPTTGYAQRLKWAMTEGPRPMSARALAAKLSEDHPHLRGTSYGGVRHYAEGKPANPRVELLRAMAATLGVRGDWLAFNRGESLEKAERARVKALRMAESGLPPKEDFQAARLRDAVLDALGLPPAPILVVDDGDVGGRLHGRAAAPMPPWVGSLGQVWQAAVVADVEAGAVKVDAEIEANIGAALAAPLVAMGVRAEALHRRGKLTRYIMTMIPALLLVSDERGLDRTTEEQNG